MVPLESDAGPAIERPTAFAEQARLAPKAVHWASSCVEFLRSRLLGKMHLG